MFQQQKLILAVGVFSNQFFSLMLGFRLPFFGVPGGQSNCAAGCGYRLPGLYDRAQVLGCREGHESALDWNNHGTYYNSWERRFLMGYQAEKRLVKSPQNQ